MMTLKNLYFFFSSFTLESDRQNPSINLPSAARRRTRTTHTGVDISEDGVRASNQNDEQNYCTFADRARRKYNEIVETINNIKLTVILTVALIYQMLKAIYNRFEYHPPKKTDINVKFN